MSILRKISSFAATTLVAAAPLCIGFCSAPLALAAPSDTPVTSTSSPNPADQTQDLSQWAKDNCPGGEQFVNDAQKNTPIYLGYANGKTYLGYTNTNWRSGSNSENAFIDTRSDAKFKEKFGTCVRVAADKTDQPTAKVFYGTLFKADKAALVASGFSEKTETIFQVTKVKPYVTGTKVESRFPDSDGNYQQMPHSVVNGGSDSGFVNTLLSTENSIELSFTQSGFYTINLKASTVDPENPAKSYQSEMAYTFIVGKKAPIPQDLQNIVDGNTGISSDSQTPNHGDGNVSTIPGTISTPEPPTGSSTSRQVPGHSSSSRLQASSRLGGTNSARLGGSVTRAQLPQPLAGAFPTLPDPATNSAEAGNQAGTNPDSDAANSPNSDSQANNQNPLKFQAANTSTKQAAQQWIRSSSLAVFVVGLTAAGLTGLGLLAFSRLHP